MRVLDLLSFTFDNLTRNVGRVAMTAIGVVIGTASVVVLVSLGIGMQRNATQQLWGINELSQIQVWPGYSDPGQGGMVVYSGGSSPALEPTIKLITDDTLAELAVLPNVVGVYPRDWLQPPVQIRLGMLEGWPSIYGMQPEMLDQLGYQLASGVAVPERGQVVVGSRVPQAFYNPRQQPGQEAPPPPELQDMTLRVTLMKWTNEGTEIRRTIQLTVVGVLTEVRSDADWNIFMRLDEVESFNQWFLGRRINRDRDGYAMATVEIEDPANAQDTADDIISLGYQASTPAQIIEGISGFFTLLQIGFGGVGAIALIVAAIGIANTMTMAILERTREIGLMKAVGARNRDILSAFLGEAAGIGILGGLCGIGLGWLASRLITVLALVYSLRQSSVTGVPPAAVEIDPPIWLLGLALAFSSAMGLASGVYPALRAATLLPVRALRTE